MKNGGLILWKCYRFLRNVEDLLADGKTPYEGYFGVPFKGPIIFFLVQWLNIMFFLHGTSQGSTNTARKFCQDYSSDMNWSRGEFGKEIFWLQTWRNWKSWMYQKFILE